MSSAKSLFSDIFVPHLSYNKLSKFGSVVPHEVVPLLISQVAFTLSHGSNNSETDPSKTLISPLLVQMSTHFTSTISPNIFHSSVNSLVVCKKLGSLLECTSSCHKNPRKLIK